MSKHDIMEMPAGRELDALIAEHVIGWMWLPYTTGRGRPCHILCPPGTSPLKELPHGEQVSGPQTAAECEMLPLIPRVILHHALPRYSIDIAAAWEVILATRARDWWWKIESHHGKDGGWEGSVWMDHKSDPEGTRSICWEAETPQLAICRAALYGVMLLNSQSARLLAH